MTAHEIRIAYAVKAKKLEAIRNVLCTYFEVDPWTGEHTGLYDDMLTAQDAIDEIVNILK